MVSLSLCTLEQANMLRVVAYVCALLALAHGQTTNVQSCKSAPNIMIIITSHLHYVDSRIIVTIVVSANGLIAKSIDQHLSQLTLRYELKTTKIVT